MHNGQENTDNAEQKNDQPQANALVTTTAATTSSSLIPEGLALRSVAGFLRGARELEPHITTCHQTGRELVALSQDLSRLLTTETPNIVRLPEILTRRLSAFFPIAQGENIVSKMQSAMFNLMTCGVNPALALCDAQQVMGAGVAKIDQGKYVLESAVHSAGGPTSSVLDICNIYAGISSLYNTYTELNRLYNSILFCSERMYTSAQELMELTGSKEQWEDIKAELTDYWNQPGFDFNTFLNQAKEQFQTILKPLKSMIALYESMEPMRIASYLALTMQTEPDAKSQLDQVTEMLTNACCNTVLDNISTASKNVGNTLGRALPAAGIKTLKNVGTKAALTACATAVTGISFPITIAVLAACTDKKNREALIAYAKSHIVGSEAGETKSDENVRAIVSNELGALGNENSSLFARLKAQIPTTVSARVNAAMEGCIDASGNVVGAFAEQAIRTLMQDSDFAPTLRDQLDPVIYQVLDQTLRQTLQIPEQKAFLERIESMSAGEAAAYQVSGALIPDMVNWLALPSLVEQHLQTATGNPHICSATGKPLALKEKAIQGVTRMLRVGIEANVAAASDMIKAGQAAKNAIKGTTNPSPSPAPAALGNTTESQLLALGSTANSESKTGLRVYLVEVPHNSTIEDAQSNASMLAPAIVFSTKNTTSLMGLRNNQLIEIKGFKLSKKSAGAVGAIASLVTDRTRTVSMEMLEKENAKAKAKSQSESNWLADLKNQSMAVIQETSRTDSTPSVLLPLDHPLVKSLTEQLHHKQQKEFNYVEQNAMQQKTLVTQKQRAIDREASEKQAAELQKAEVAAAKAGFNTAFFDDFETTAVIQERYMRLLEVLKTVDTLLINIEPEDVDKAREYIKTRLVNRSQALLTHINAANERLRRDFNTLDIDTLPIKSRLAAIEKAIGDVDNLGWFASAVAPEARTHYLALLDLQKREAESTITALSKPLKDLEEGQYDLVTNYLQDNPEKATLLATEVLHYKKTFWMWQSWPKGLLKLDQCLLEILSKNKPAESVPSVTIHLLETPVIPVLMFGGVPKSNVPLNVSDKPESKSAHDYKAEEELQLANALKLSEAETIAASKSKIGPKTIAGWELTDVPEIGNCFYEAVALQLQKNDFPIAETFPETKAENGGTALVDILRRRSTPEFRDRDWAGEEEILALAKELKIVIAIVDTRSENPEFQYYFANWNGTMGTTRNKTEIPQGQMVAELAYTGNHYLSVTSKPSSPTSPRR